MPEEAGDIVAGDREEVVEDVQAESEEPFGEMQGAEKEESEHEEGGPENASPGTPAAVSTQGCCVRSADAA